MTTNTNASPDLLTVTNDQGRPFNVRIVREGDEYGRNDCLVHDGEPMIEFYDATYADVRFFGPRGQFVSRYNLSTLMAAGIAQTRGLNLDGGVLEWTVSAANVAEALAFAETEIAYADAVAYMAVAHPAVTYQAQRWYTNTTKGGRPSWDAIGDETPDYATARATMVAAIEQDHAGTAESAYRVEVIG